VHRLERVHSRPSPEDKNYCAPLLRLHLPQMVLANFHYEVCRAEGNEYWGRLGLFPLPLVQLP
jgi:hypothetical protein